MRSSSILAVLLLAAHSQLALALPADADLPMDIAAEHKRYDKTKGETILTGSVEITQGSMVLRADEVIHKSNEQDETISCSGSPVYFEVKTLEYGLITGHANSIHYDRNNGTLTLTQEAKITQEDGSYTLGNKISYDIAAEQLTFEGKPNERTETHLPSIRSKKEKTDGDS